jgi:methionyl-tRNA synthetase
LRKILVTTALPYANGPIHLGHIAGCYLPADIYTRYQRMRGNNVIHIGGTDENGVPITIKAEEKGKTPQEVVDYYHKSIKESFNKFGIEFDNFSRTSIPLHHKIVQDFFLNLYNKGYIIPKIEEQFFCQKCQRFLPDRYVEGTCPYCGFEGARGDQCDECGRLLEPKDLKNPRCKVCGSTPVLRKTKQWFFRLDLLESRLKEWLLTKKNWKENVRKFALGWIKEGLIPRAITRDISWGVPVPLPEAKRKVFYVWFDNVIGYISSTIEWAKILGEPEKWRDYWESQDTELVHFIGKDNIVFHAITWPAMLMAHGGFILPSQIPANEFLTIEAKQMSTSRNWAIWLDDYLNKFSPDPLRYALASNAPERSDSNFTWNGFLQKNNSELVGILGNFVNRTLRFMTNYLGGIIPHPEKTIPEDNLFLGKIDNAREEVGKSFEKFGVRRAVSKIMDLAREGNRYFDYNRPWELRKRDSGRAKTVIYTASVLAANFGLLFEPVLPFTAKKIRDILKIDESRWDDIGKPLIHEGMEIENLTILFNKIDRETIEIQRRKLMGKSEIKFEDFDKLDLRIAEVIDASRISGTDRLIKLKINIGTEERQIVAGIGETYTPEELKGKKIVVLCNLEPKRIRGEESNGMLLAAVVAKKPILLVPDKDVPPGSSIS